MSVVALPLCERCGQVKKPWVCRDEGVVIGEGPCESCMLKRLKHWGDKYQALVDQGVDPAFAERRTMAELERADVAEASP